MLWWIAALALPALALVIQPARAAQPDTNDMEPENPLAHAAAQFIAGLALASITLLLLVQHGVIWPVVALVLFWLAYRAAPKTAKLKIFYRWQLAIAVVGTLAAARLWYSTIS
ncbi:hypothetical protein [Pontivivens insulae]|uniref:Uncharacterized protein n=1 Tax=Pontivivens insulae TaxID=1639689 RepID=A0A2R8AA79_9RHOB|nr:hypothetical protein [Pontivivens insulae]RED13027.1 hypothetical protein DFR53_2162 [Pontivivens insulae]SPF29119.1 hypothetical protein POI8812_01425 [Pontivivens insulae]